MNSTFIQLSSQSTFKTPKLYNFSFTMVMALEPARYIGKNWHQKKKEPQNSQAT